MKKYLNYCEIQTIINKAITAQEWGTRQMVIDTLVYLYANELGDNGDNYVKYLKKHTELLEQGEFDKLKKSVKNYNQITEGLAWTESLTNILKQIGKQTPDLAEVLKNGNNNGVGTNQKNK